MPIAWTVRINPRTVIGSISTSCFEPELKAKATPAVEPKPEGKEVQLETKTEPPSDVSPQLVKRVHELYEQLGREDVRAVEDLEKAERETREKENAKNNPT